jgi:hypothetical protein
MKKLLVLALVLGMATMASATPVMKLGDATAAFSTGSSTMTMSAGGTYDLYVWASSDLVFNPDDITTGLDNIQVFLQYDTTKVNLTGGLISNLSAVAGNPFLTAWYGKSQGTFDSLGFAEGALVNMAGVDAYPLQQVMKMSLTVATPGATTTVTMMSPGGNHESFQGNSVMGDKYFATTGSVTFVPEPMTIMLLGLGGLFLRRRK